MEITKKTKIRSEKHRRFIASLPCCMSGCVDRTQAAHIRYQSNTGMGQKPSDSKCVPLSVEEHRLQHETGERKYWGDRMDRAIWLASLLWDNTGNRDRCLEIISRFRKE